MIKHCSFDGTKLRMLEGRDTTSFFKADFVAEFICPKCERRWYFSRNGFEERLVYLGKVKKEGK